MASEFIIGGIEAILWFSLQWAPAEERMGFPGFLGG